MIVTCEHCAARYKLDDGKIKGRGARITCPRCKQVFVVLAKPEAEQPAAPELPPEVATRAAEPPAAPPQPEASDPIGASAEVGGNRRSEHLDFRKVGIATWKVRVKIGLVYDFSDTSTLRKYIQDRRVTEDDVISHDGTNWVRIGDIPDLDRYFVQVYEELEAARADSEEDSSEEEFGDGPTMVVGMGSLRSNISTGVFARPQPAGESAPPTPRPLPPTPEPEQPPGQRFADPFESLKARQRERMRANRRAANSPQGRRANGKGGGKGEAPNRRNTWLAAAAAVVVIGGGYYYLRSRPAPKPNPVDVAVAAGPSAEDAAAVRERLLRQLENKLQPTDDAPPEPPEDGEINFDDLTPIRPDDFGSQRNPIQPAQHTGPSSQGGNEPSVTVSESTASEYLAAAQTAARAGDWGHAIQGYRDALKKEPRNSEAKLGLGMALYRRHGDGDVDAAQAQLAPLAAAGICPAKLWLARCLKDLGDAGGASGNYSAYLQCNPGDTTAQRELQQLTGG